MHPHLVFLPLIIVILVVKVNSSSHFASRTAFCLLRRGKGGLDIVAAA